MTTYTTVSRVVFINSGLSHGCGVDRELCLVQELPQFLFDTVAKGVGTDENDNIPAGLLDQLIDAVDDGGLDSWVIFGWLPTERILQSRGRDPLIHHIGGKGEIRRPSLC